MKFFVAALAFLVCAVADAHHAPDHQLVYPSFKVGKTYLYHVTINATSGIPGMHSQVAKSVLSTDLKIFAKTSTDLILSMDKIFVSDSLSGVGSASDAVHLKSSPELEKNLKQNFRATFKEGKVINYNLFRTESLESQKIKKTILRNLEVYLDKKVLTTSRQGRWPLTYNLTRSSLVGNYSSHYIITSSPDAYFPINQNVYNISRSDNFEEVPYLAYRTHHNFERQGCPEVCNRSQIENRFGAGCPAGFEPHHTPMKRSFVQQHTLRKERDLQIMFFDIIRTKETHIADVYDQNMEVVIRSLIQYHSHAHGSLKTHDLGPTKTDLHELDIEINEQEINQKCPSTTVTRHTIEEAKAILSNITEIVIQGNVDNEQSKFVGELLIRLQKMLTIMKKADLRSISQTIVSHDEIKNKSEFEKVKRQIWMDILPLIGSHESIMFITQLIEENMNKNHKTISLWEAKTILEALPNNILEPSGETITALRGLLELISNSNTKGYNVFYSAAHLTVSRVIRNLCSINSGILINEEIRSKMDSPRNIQNLLRRQSEEHTHKTCPKDIAKKFIQDISTNLKATSDRTKRIIYIQTLARTGLHQALSSLIPYVNGRVSGYTQSYVDYLRTVTIHALHNLVREYPREIQDIVQPVFFNTTEPPKVRIAAFGVFVKSYPTLGALQQVAEQTWREPSHEVASYVTSTFETLGNSTVPCHQLTAQRIKKVLPQIKRVCGGHQRAKNIYTNIYDEIRRFGVETHFEHSPSNESFIPSTIYGSTGYNSDSLRDTFFQYALTSQGLTSRNVVDRILREVGISPAQDIPKEKENDIFPHTTIESRDPEFWRFTVFNKLFYTSSYYYFDEEQKNTQKDFWNLYYEHFSNYFSSDSQGNTEGRIVKVYMPASYRSKAVAHTLPYPVVFEMNNPLLLSVKIALQKTTTSSTSTPSSDYSLDISPSVYHSTIYTNQFLNLGDCKNVGVYHEKRIAAAYPFKVRFSWENLGKFNFTYSFPQLPKKVFSYFSESGTFAGKKILRALPLTEERTTIKTLPSQFEKKSSFGVIGLPHFESKVRTENIQICNEETPRTPKEAIQQAIRHFLNAGWRRESIEISRVDDIFWPTSSTEVQVNFNFSREFETPANSDSEQDWENDLNFNDCLDQKDTKEYIKVGKNIHDKLVRFIPHIKDAVHVQVLQTDKGKFFNTASFNASYRHTVGGSLHMVRINASATISKLGLPINVTADYIVGFTNRPNEFEYAEDSYGSQMGVSVASLSFSEDGPYKYSNIAAKAVFRYQPLDSIFENKMVPAPSANDLLPETHEECITDVRKGKSQSVACIKAMRETAIFNKVKVHAIWNKDLPLAVQNAAQKLDLALKHVFYSHMTSESKSGPRGLTFEATYINKMTDRPVIDMVLVKPTEILTFHKVSAGLIQPVSSIDSIVDTYAQKYTNNTYPATCALMDKYVTTYDLMTYPMPLEDQHVCDFILSAHCTDFKKFAVLVSFHPEEKRTKKVEIHIGSHNITLKPANGDEYTVTYNRQSVKAENAILLSESEQIYISQSAGNNSHFIEVRAIKAGIKITYNGRNVKVQVDPRYKGELCGLCSEFNGETAMEMKGVNKCVYSHSWDFARSSMVGNCRNTDRPRHPYFCIHDPYYGMKPTKDSEEEMENEYKPTMKRNMVLNKGSELCFSTKPVPVCENNAAPKETENEEIDFHCLPKQDTNARKLVTESRRRILGEMETKRVDRTESAEIAKSC